MVSEMLAILIFEVAEPEINGASMTEAAQRELFGSSFEKLGQERRVSIPARLWLDRRHAEDVLRPNSDDAAPIPASLVQGLRQAVR